MSDARGSLVGNDLASLRQGCYRLFAVGFTRPTPETVESIGNGLTALHEMGVGMFPFARWMWEWKEALDNVDLGILVTEHVRLFGSGMDGALCVPIESQHLGLNLQGDPARYAARNEDLMRRAGFTARDDDLPPDHLIVELDLAAALCGAESNELRSDGNPGPILDQQQELIDVMALWVPSFASVVRERDGSGVLGRLADATSAFLTHEVDLVRLLLAAEAAV